MFSLTLVILLHLLSLLSSCSTLVHSTSIENCKGEVPIEHFFFDLQKTTTKFVSLEYLEQEGNFRSPVSLKLKCKAAGCPEVNGTQVFFSGVPHHQEELTNTPFWVEETSGWLLFYHDEEWKKPLLLTEKTITQKEQDQGFVYFETKKGTKNGGVLKFKCDV